jgi:hypothetical protein
LGAAAADREADDGVRAAAEEGAWFLVSGFWFLVSGFWFLVSGLSHGLCSWSPVVVVS